MDITYIWILGTKGRKCLALQWFAALFERNTACEILKRWEALLKRKSAHQKLDRTLAEWYPAQIREGSAHSNLLLVYHNV